MTKNVIIEKLAAINLLTGINAGTAEEKTKNLAESLGAGFLVILDDSDEEGGYLVKGVKTARADITSSILKALGVDSREAYNELLTDAAELAVDEFKKTGEGFDSVGARALSFLLDFFNTEGGVYLEGTAGGIKITPDGGSCYPTSYNLGAFLKTYSE